MKRKDLDFLFTIDTALLANIAIQELNLKRNTYYDLVTKDAIVYPEDDIDGLEIRPLHTRLLKNGNRFSTELSKFIAKSIQYAMAESIT